MATPRTAEAQRFLEAMHDELASNADAACLSLAFSAAERETLGNVAALIDRKVELRQAYEDAADDTRLRIALSTEVRLIEQAITRMLRTVDMRTTTMRRAPIHATRSGKRSTTRSPTHPHPLP
jgi:hypothetical protein